MTFRISGLIQTSNNIHQEMDVLISNSRSAGKVTFSSPKVAHLRNQILQIVQGTERICNRRKATPADLPNPSYKAYIWLRFLSEKKWLLCHLYGLYDFYEIIKETSSHPLTKVNPALVRIISRNSNYLFRCKQNNQEVEIEINEGFISAPRDIKGAIIANALGRKNKKKINLIKEYTRKSAYQTINDALQGENQINKISHKGNFYNLEAIFNQLNRAYFNGALSRARLSWSPRQSKRRLGYYHAESDAITISRSLDNENVPRLLVEFILYHEMLHKAMGIKESNGRRYAHTREFQNNEKKFEHFEAARREMVSFCNSKI